MALVYNMPFQRRYTSSPQPWRQANDVRSTGNWASPLLKELQSGNDDHTSDLLYISGGKSEKGKDVKECKHSLFSLFPPEMYSKSDVWSSLPLYCSFTKGNRQVQG